jgi:hypothetical protein
VEKESLTLKRLFDFITEKKRTISIIGLEKNIGKTTFLNFLLEGLSREYSGPLILSIGRDGEEEDRLEKTKKPRIKIYKGQYFISIDSLLSNSPCIEILDNFGQLVSGANVFLARALEDTYVEIINPGSISLIRKIVEQSKSKFDISTVLIDGALDRKSHASSRLADGVFICSGAQVEGTVNDIIKKTETLIDRLEKQECSDELKDIIASDHNTSGLLIIRKNNIILRDKCTLLELEVFEQCLKDGDIIYTTGIITDSLAKRILETNKKIRMIVDDGTKIMMERITEKRLLRSGLKINLIYSIPVYGIVLSSVGIRKSFNPSSLLSSFKERFRERLVLDIQFID